MTNKEKLCYWCSMPVSFEESILGDIGLGDFRLFHTKCWGAKLQGAKKGEL